MAPTSTCELPPRLTSTGASQSQPFGEHLGLHEAKEQLLESFEREHLGALLKRSEGNLSRAARENGQQRSRSSGWVKKSELDAR